MHNNILLEKAHGIATVTLNRPRQMNAINSQMIEELGQTLDALATDATVRVVVLTGAGEKAFAAGADIAAMADMTPLDAKDFAEFGQRVFARLEALPQPTIAMVRGVALGGGCELALACDMRIAAVTARFGQPEVSLGITTGFGGTQRLPRLVGRSKAAMLLYSGMVIKAQEALAMGLVDQVVSAETLCDTVMELARSMSGHDPFAVRQTKLCIRHGLESGRDAGLAYEAQAFGLCYATSTPRLAMTAFINKRK